MLFPSFHIPLLGDGMTIAMVAVTHVLISHGLAIGMLTLIVVLQHIGLRNNDHEILAMAQRMLKPVVIIVTAVGAVTGAGIWFTVSVLAPNGIGSLLRVFFWPWFFEWIAFSLEVFILLPYYFLWDRMNATHPKRHLALGWSYVFVAFVSAFLISGILGFMLTPDGWVQEHALWTAFFNPTFWPQLFLRVLGGLTLGGLLSTGYILYSFRLDLELRRWTARFFGGWIIVCGSLAAVAAWFYFDAIPSTYATHKVFAVMTSHFSQQPQWLLLANLLAAAFVFGLALVAYFRRLRLAHVLIIPALLSAFLFVVQFERIREFIRGPYLIPGYMYANQISLTLSEHMSRTGLLDSSAWAAEQPERLNPVAPAGHALFIANCGVCHTIGGLNDIRDRLLGRSQPAVNVLIRRTNEMVPFMPPFSGTPSESNTLAAYLYELAGNQRSINAVPPIGRKGVDNE